jgi:hypothetical protein
VTHAASGAQALHYLAFALEDSPAPRQSRLNRTRTLELHRQPGADGTLRALRIGPQLVQSVGAERKCEEAEPEPLAAPARYWTTNVSCVSCVNVTEPDDALADTVIV